MAADYNRKLRETYMQQKDTGERERLLEENKCSFEALGGVQAQIEEITNWIEAPLKHSKCYEFIGIKPSKGILVHGPCGSGKTSFVYGAGNHSRLPVISVTRADFISGSASRSDNGQQEAIAKKIESLLPAIVLIEALDMACKRKENLDSEADRRVVDRMVDFLDALPMSAVLIATATTPDDIDPVLRRSGRIDREVALRVPSVLERKEILEKTLGKIRCKGINIDGVAVHTPGYVGADIVALITEAGHCAVLKALKKQKGTPSPESLWITQEDMDQALKKVQPSARKEGFTVVPETTFDDIGALDEVKGILEMAIIQPTLNPEMFASVGIKKPSGVLLHGPPGTGKTMLARAIANQTHCNFISVKGPEIINMYYGESERSIRRIFSRARASAPCVIFFDEIDSICGSRGSGASRFGDTLVNQLLVEMDGLQERGAVYLIGATNRLDIIDRALLRPGRFDSIIEVAPPTEKDLQTILGKKLCSLSVSPSVRCGEFTLRGLTGADIDLLVREAGSLSIQDIAQNGNNRYDTKCTTTDTNTPQISHFHLQKALETVRERKKRIDPFGNV